MDIHIRYLKTFTQSIYKGRLSQIDEVGSYKTRKKITRYRRLLNPLVTSGRKKVFKTVEWVIAPGISPRGRNSRGGILVAGRLPDTSLSFTNRKQFARHSFNLFAGIRLSPQTSKTNESKASSFTEIR